MTTPPLDKNRTRQVLKRGQFTEVPDSEVDYEFTSPGQFFSSSLVLIPMVNTVQSQRTFYTSRFFNQATPIHEGEAPLVQTLKDPKTGETFEDYIGNQMGVVRSDDDDEGSTVTDVTPDYITYKTAKGQKKTKPLYNHLPFNRKTSITNHPLVKVGDKLKKGQLLARSNYTDNNGTFNMGRNARIAVVPYKGWSYEDGIVISEDFAKKMASEHMYSYGQDFESREEKKNTETNRDKFVALFPKKYTKDQLANIDENGIVKVGSTVKQGDPLILATAPRMVSSKDADLGRLSKYLKRTRNDVSKSWDHESDGVVTDVVKTKNGWKVNVSSIQPTREGDKLSIGRAGNKGTITKIIPQHLVPRTSDGRPVDILFNPMGIISRVNSNLIYSLMLGKIAEKTGKPIKVPSFNKSNEKWYEYVENLMKEHGITDAEELYDPEKDRVLDQPVTVGNDFIIKLHHTAESKLSSRSTGAYDLNEQPVKGGFEGGQCFAPKTPINSMYGPIDIAHLCEKKLRIPVMTYDFERQEWCYKNVTDWFVRRAKVNELINVQFCTNAYRNVQSQYKIFNQASICVTKNHMVLREDGTKVPIGQLKEGDSLYTYGPVPTEDQMALLYGTLLGDGYAHKDERSINIQHGAVQLNYLKWKQRILSSLNCKISSEYCAKEISQNSLSNKPVKAYSINLSYGWLAKKLRNECYASNGRKTVTKEWLDKLTELSVVALFLDDGYLRNYSNTRQRYEMSIYLYSFTQKENEMIANRIKELTGIEFRVVDGQYSKDNRSFFYPGGTLVCTKKEYVQKMIQLLLKYVPLENITKYKANMIKMALKYDTINIPEKTVELNIQAKIGLIPVEIRKIKPYKHDKPNVDEINVYDFTVEDTHSYLAGNVLVSNSKRYSGLENHGVLSAGAYEFIKDAIHLRGQRNDDYWQAVRNGETPSLAKTSPFVWDKYLALMQGSGINTIDKGNGVLQLSPFTDKQFANMEPKELENPYIVDLNTMKPVPGGLFDPTNSLTNKWSKITLTEPYPNPGFEDAIVSLLGTKKKDMYAIMNGEEELGEYGKGTQAIKKALSNINMDELFDTAKNQFKSGPKSQKQKALNIMKYIKGLKRNKLTPDELMISAVPVLPAKFRPYSAIGDTFIPGDVNELYKDVFQMRDSQKELYEELGEEEAMKNSMNMYNSIKALYGLGDSMNKKLQQRGVSGFMNKLVGGTSKFSFLNRNVNSKTTDFTGRAVIDVNPDLSMNEVGLPKKMAFDMFAPYIQQELVRRGVQPADAIESIAKQDDSALKALEEVIKKRPVMYSRAPAWHKYNTVGGWVKLHDGDNILVSPMITSGASADFDGDMQVAYVLVATPRAK